MIKINKSIIAKSHPPHYMMHKYWGRKPHNVVCDYILSHTKKGDTVLDPFMGSGVVVIESLKHDRKAIGIDLNPMACFITKNTINNIDFDDFDINFEKIYQRNYKLFSNLYLTKCPNCNEKTYFENSIWDQDRFLRIRGTCKSCGKFVKDTDKYDLELVKNSKKVFLKLDKQKKIDYPKDEILKFVKRNGKETLNRFFTERALVVLGTIIKDIRNVKNKNTKELLLLCFTSMLPNVSKMIPGNEISVNGRSGWVISKLWSPKIHTEKNPFYSFRDRFNKVKKGKKELSGTLDSNDAKILNIDSSNLKTIKNSSIDYIFTDPPYGDSIAYFGLSMFWNAWLKNHVDYANEIIYDPYRDKRYDDYALRMKRVYSELYRVLRDKKYLSFTFHNRNLNIWKAVMDAVMGAGFHLVNVVYQEQAVSSGTQGINRNNTLRGDFIYNFLKNTDIKTKNKIECEKDGNKKIVKKVNSLIRKNGGIVSSDHLYEKLIPFIVENQLYKDKNDKIINIESLLKDHFAYDFIKTKKEYGWQEK